APRFPDTWDLDDMLHPRRAMVLATLATMCALYEAHGIDRYDLVGHSKGGGTAVDTAWFLAEDPDALPGLSVRSVTVVDSVGSTDHSTAELAIRAPFVVHRALAARHRYKFASDEPPATIRDTLDYALPCLARTGIEGLDCGVTDLRPGIKALRRSNVPVAALAHVNDEFFPGRRAERHIGELVNAFALGEPVPKAGHFAFQIEPAAVMADHDELLTRML
ncbi:MAG TPA: alpha/beta hydrolase, partial [Candidatus Saccharimonadales bacterium]|nr:alpha/beta hydrolase [Candidatus Saccharimonadales bacterium]